MATVKNNGTDNGTVGTLINARPNQAEKAAKRAARAQRMFTRTLVGDMSTLRGCVKVGGQLIVQLDFNSQDQVWDFIQAQLNANPAPALVQIVK